MRERKEEVCVRDSVSVWSGRESERQRKRPRATPLLILFHTAKFSIQHVSQVMESEREREREKREARARSREGG